jgi:hypothetical protein
MKLLLTLALLALIAPLFISAALGPIASEPRGVTATHRTSTLCLSSYLGPSRPSGTKPFPSPPITSLIGTCENLRPARSAA